MKYADDWFWDWHKKTIIQTEEILDTNILQGLSSKEAISRQSKYGKNKLQEQKKRPLILHFFDQFNDFMILALLGAAVVSFVLSLVRGEADFIDSIIILVIVTLNAVLGVVQENKAEKALEALKKMTAPLARVRRNGQIVSIQSENLVPGDIVLLETGDFVPADVRLTLSNNLKIEESALTGESVSVEKRADILLDEDTPTAMGDRKNMAYSTTIVSLGRGEGIVVDTGMATEVGKIAKMIIEDQSPQTPLQKRLEKAGKMLGIAAIVICAVIFALGINSVGPFEMFMTSVSLAVAAIPEGLPAIVTIMLSIGVTRMARKNAIVKKLPAVETLGSATVICSDKTGTLTQNKMKVVEAYATCGTTEVWKAAALCNDSILSKTGTTYTAMGDPTETALLIAAAENGCIKTELEVKNRRVAEIPFDSERKLMTTIHTTENHIYKVLTKGAPDVLLDVCRYILIDGEIRPINAENKRHIADQNGKMADKALRVIGMAYKHISAIPDEVTSRNIENDLVFVGLLGMIDPPREEAQAAVEKCKKAGIKPVMITGDHKRTAIAIAKKIGILYGGKKVLTGNELAVLTQDELCKVINEYSVFARVTPEHKVRIVKAFQANDEVVAMTGDGVNDAPALKAADIGCAMGISGTDVAKSASDMILTDDNFATIVEAVSEGRGIYSNIKKAVHFLLSSNIGEIITIFVAVLLKWPPPLLAIHLLWVNLVTDSLPAIALGVDPFDDDIMEDAPISPKKSLFADGLAAKIALEGVMIGMLSLIAFFYGNLFSTECGRTMAFATLSISQLFHAFNMRSSYSLFKIDLLGNKYLICAFFAGLLLQVSVISIAPLASIFKVVPISLSQWLIVGILSFMPIIIVELQKAFSHTTSVKNSEAKSV